MAKACAVVRVVSNLYCVKARSRFTALILLPETCPMLTELETFLQISQNQFVLYFWYMECKLSSCWLTFNVLEMFFTVFVYAKDNILADSEHWRV